MVTRLKVSVDGRPYRLEIASKVQKTPSGFSVFAYRQKCEVTGVLTWAVCGLITGAIVATGSKGDSRATVLADGVRVVDFNPDMTRKAIKSKPALN